MSDIAGAVGVGSSALYRHFASKQQLLNQIVLDELQPFREIAAAVSECDLDQVVSGLAAAAFEHRQLGVQIDRKSTRLNSSHVKISYAVFCLKKKKVDHVTESLRRYRI